MWYNLNMKIIAEPRLDGRRIELYHIPQGESIASNTTTSGRKIHGPASVLRIYYPDGACETTVYNYESNGVISDFMVVRSA